MCEMSFRPPAAYETQPDYVAGLLKQWCDHAVHEYDKDPRKNNLVDTVYIEWDVYIRSYGAPTKQHESKVIISNFFQERANEYKGLPVAADRYIDLASQLLNNVRWIGQSANASYANALYEGRTYLS